ncbi:hypothetical protein [Kitasatospora acidiphila]|uniref:hypothetical protein n=1 Tax=Kitasatospora acidiphila TaxID=2567942 RepID=UPI003C720EB9
MREPVVHAEAWQAGATLHAALTQYPARSEHTHDEDELDEDQEHGLFGDISRPAPTGWSARSASATGRWRSWARCHLPAPTKREQVAALVSTPDDPWWEERVLHAKLYPVEGHAA